MPQGQTAYVVTHALRALAVEPRSAPHLAEAIDIDSRIARRLLVVLSGMGLVERVPDDTWRKRYRIAERGRLLGGILLLATQAVEPFDSLSRPSNGRGPTVRTFFRVLQAIADEPQSGLHLAERLGLGRRSAEKMVAALARLGLIERVPDDPIRRRHRIAERGRALGAVLVLAKHEAEPYQAKGRGGPRNRRPGLK